ncbi:MAG: glycerophosphodiester phosphodiesterase [Gemmatimonadetes bacterium]|nr:glycerophosphodiester phosphodiesterase [Gemmatimonadota bacterium]
MLGISVRPEVIAHRGASREAPENSLRAFARAAELGANAIELDLHLTTDGVLVVHHDPLIHSAAGEVPINQRSSAELAGILVRDEPVPRFADVLTLAAERGLTVYAEAKGRGTGAAAARLLAHAAANGSVSGAVHSFDHREVASAGRAQPTVPRGVLEVAYHVEPAGALRDVGARDLWQQAQMIDRALVDATHAAGGRVIAWTANAPELIRHLIALGVDGICTDDVALARTIVDSAAA